MLILKSPSWQNSELYLSLFKSHENNMASSFKRGDDAGGLQSCFLQKYYTHVGKNNLSILSTMSRHGSLLLAYYKLYFKVSRLLRQFTSLVQINTWLCGGCTPWLLPTFLSVFNIFIFCTFMKLQLMLKFRTSGNLTRASLQGCFAGGQDMLVLICQSCSQGGTISLTSPCECLSQKWLTYGGWCKKRTDGHYLFSPSSLKRVWRKVSIYYI